MKKLFVALLAVAGLTACFNEEVVRVQDPTAISFEANWVENATRANVAVDPSTTTESLEGFNVWGFIDTPEGKVFEAEDVTRNSERKFTYVNTQYWLPGHDYYFAALAPMDSANVTVDTTDANEFGLGVVTFENINGTEDLIYAANVEEAPALGTAKTVKFTFSHLLSKVKFSFTNGFTNDLAYIDVKNIKMVVPSQASIDLAQADWWSTNQWELIDAVPTTLEFGDACAKTAAGVKQVSANERLTIPADDTQAYKVTFDVVLYFGDVVAFEKTLVSNIEGVALEMGKAYNFTATLDHTNISGEDNVELQPIVFDVEEVKDWVEAGDQDLAVDGYIKNMVLDADYQATEKTVKIAGNLIGNGYTLSAVEGVNYVVSNTARLIETKDDATIENIKIDGKNNVYEGYGIRGIYTTGTGNVVVKNAEILNCTYAINANNAGTITVLNSTLQGWNSYGSTTKNHFENVKFIDGTYHNFRPYNNTVCKNCDFGAGVVIDLSCLVEGATIKFENCTVAGKPLSALNLEAAEGKNVTIEMVVTEAPASDALLSDSASNVTIDGGNLRTADNKPLRGIYITKGGNYTFDNVVVRNVTYALNVSTTADVTLAVSNSTLEGWTSFGDSTTATFNNVKFECGKYANFKPYASTTLTGCSFEKGFMIDFTSLTGKITFVDCTYDGVAMTEESFVNGTVKIDGDFTGKIAF